MLASNNSRAHRALTAEAETEADTLAEADREEDTLADREPDAVTLPVTDAVTDALCTPTCYTEREGDRGRGGRV
jgi:hypothetical protein